MNFHRRLLMLLVFTLVVALAGFNGVAQGQAVKNPDTLIVQSFGDPESLDPAWEYDTTSSALVVWNIYETLVFFSGARTDLYEPLLATILGFDTQSTRDDKGALIPDIYDRTNRAIQVKGDTVAITLKDPYSPFLSILATWSVVQSKKFVVANGGWDGSKATLASF